MSDSDGSTIPRTRQIEALAARQEGLLTGAQLTRLGGADAWLFAALQSGYLFEVDGDVYQHGAHGMRRDDFERAVWFRQNPEAFPEERLGPDRTPRLILSGSLALTIAHGDPSGGQVIFACDELPADRTDLAAYVTRPIRPGEWEWIRGVPVARRTLAIADMVLTHDDEDDIHHALVDAITASQLAAAQFVDLVRPAAAYWGFDPDDGRAVLDRFLRQDVVSHRWTGAQTTIHLTRDTLDFASSTPIHPGAGGHR